MVHVADLCVCVYVSVDVLQLFEAHGKLSAKLLFLQKVHGDYIVTT